MAVASAGMAVAFGAGIAVANSAGIAVARLFQGNPCNHGLFSCFPNATYPYT